MSSDIYSQDYRRLALSDFGFHCRIGHLVPWCYVCVGTWNLCTGMVKRKGHASATSAHTVELPSFAPAAGELEYDTQFNATRLFESMKLFNTPRL